MINKIWEVQIKIETPNQYRAVCGILGKYFYSNADGALVGLYPKVITFFNYKNSYFTSKVGLLTNTLKVSCEEFTSAYYKFMDTPIC